MEKYGIFDFSPWKREYPKPAKVEDGTCWGRIWSFQISISCTIEVRGAPYIIYIMIYHIQPGSTNPIPLTQLQVQWSTCTKHFSLHLSVLSSSPPGTQPFSNMWTMSLSKNAWTHFSAQISCKGPILLFRMISVKPTWPRGQFGGTLYSIEIKGS